MALEDVYICFYAFYILNNLDSILDINEICNIFPCSTFPPVYCHCWRYFKGNLLTQV